MRICALLGVLAVLEDRHFARRSWRERRLALASGVFFAFDLVFWHRSIEDVGTGLATVLANIQVAIVPLVAWWILSERPARRVLAALPIALLGDAHLVPKFPGAWWLITLALTSQVFGWLLITSSLPRLPAALTSLLLTVQPVCSVGLAALIFGESPSGLQLFGVGIVLGALLTATAPRPAERRRAQELNPLAE